MATLVDLSFTFQFTDLFHRVISQSGSALAIWASLGNGVQTDVLRAQASFVGCEKYLGNNEQVIYCLRNVSAYDIVQSQDNFKVKIIITFLSYHSESKSYRLRT